MRVLGLHSWPNVTTDDGLNALSEVLADLEIDVPGSRKDHTIVTVEDQSEYEFPHYVVNVAQIEWPDDWKLTIQQVDPSRLQRLRQDLLSDTDIVSSAQPTYYAMWRRNDGKHILALERAATVDGDLSIVLQYHPSNGTVIAEDQQLEIPSTQFELLRYGVTWKLAENFIPDRAAYFLGLYEQKKRTWKARMTFPDKQSIHRPTLWF